MSAVRELTPDELRDEQIIQAVVQGHPIDLVAHAHDVTIEHIDSLFQPPRFARSPATAKALELARLDVATQALMARVANGDLGAIGLLLKVQNRRSRYLGLDAPVSVNEHRDVNVHITWASPERLSYQRAEVVDAKPAEWKEPEPDGLAQTMRLADKK